MGPHTKTVRGAWESEAATTTGSVRTGHCPFFSCGMDPATEATESHLSGDMDSLLCWEGSPLQLSHGAILSVASRDPRGPRKSRREAHPQTQDTRKLSHFAQRHMAGRRYVRVRSQETAGMTTLPGAPELPTRSLWDVHTTVRLSGVRVLEQRAKVKIRLTDTCHSRSSELSLWEARCEMRVVRARELGTRIPALLFTDPVTLNQ